MKGPSTRVLLVVVLLGAALGAIGLSSQSYAESGQRSTFLYDQRDNGASTFVSSTRWGDPAYKAGSALGADDFIVPQGETWLISAVDVDGDLGNQTRIESKNLAFYLDAGGLPGERIASYHRHGTPGIRGDFKVTLPRPGLTLTAGTYWVSVQANLWNPDIDEWYWHTRSVQSNNPGVWVQPHRPTCNHWMPTTQCISSAGPDWMFALEGRIQT
jgi:hypothetical protein